MYTCKPATPYKVPSEHLEKIRPTTRAPNKSTPRSKKGAKGLRSYSRGTTKPMRGKLSRVVLKAAAARREVLAKRVVKGIK